MTTLLLVRHAPTDETATRLTGRTPGVWLGENGIAQAEAVAARLQNTKVGNVYTSPVERCLHTARIVAAGHGLEPIEEPGISEIDFGTWQGRTYGSLRRTKLWRTAQTAPATVRFPEGESFLEAQVRAVAACNRIAAAERGTVIVVSHADVIKLCISHYLGQPIDLFQRIAIAPASVSAVAMSSDGPPTVLSVNGNS